MKSLQNVPKPPQITPEDPKIMHFPPQTEGNPVSFKWPYGGRFSFQE